MNYRKKVVSFLNAIGIVTKRGRVPKDSVLKHVAIVNGGIVFDVKVRARDLLHEAGHLALIPGKYRPLCSGNMDKSVQKIWDKATAEGEMAFEDYIYRSLLQSSDTEATAWAWAAGKYLGLPEKQIISDSKYEYDSEGKEIRFMLGIGRYLGIHGLRAAGMIDSVKDYPKLKRWLQ